MFRKRIGNYYVGRTLGEGTYAKVKYAQHVETGDPVAIKVMDKARLEERGLMRTVKREIAILKNLKHPHVVDLIEVMASKERVYMVLEFMPGGELLDRILADGPLSEDAARTVFQQLLDGLQYCHAQGVFHRDLKPENMLVGADGAVKLSDFGLGALPDAARGDGLLRTTCGTPNYVAPEVLARRGYAGGPADLWSLGVCLYVMTTATLPFDEVSLPALYRKIAVGAFSTPRWLSAELVHLLAAMLQPDPAQRPTCEQLRLHPWVDPECRLLGAMRAPPTPLSPRSQAGDPFGTPVEPQPLTQVEQVKALRRISRDVALPAPLNAFQLIGAALDISALFEARGDVVARHTRFTTRAPPPAVLAALEAAAQQRGGAARRRDGARTRLMLRGDHGPVALAVEVLPLLPGVAMVDVQRAGGDPRDFVAAYRALSAAVAPLVAANALPAAAPALEGPLATGTAAPAATAPKDWAAPTRGEAGGSRLPLALSAPGGVAAAGAEGGLGLRGPRPGVDALVATPSAPDTGVAPACVAVLARGSAK